MSLFQQKSIFNLNDEEELTHAGKALTDLTMKDQIVSSDDEENEMLDGKNCVICCSFLIVHIFVY